MRELTSKRLFATILFTAFWVVVVDFAFDVTTQVALADYPSKAFWIATLLGAGVGWIVFWLADFAEGRSSIIGLTLGAIIQGVILILFTPSIQY